jgi:hypothetical protein
MGSSGDVAVVLAAMVLSVMLITILLLFKEWRHYRAGDGATLVHDAERWLREQSRGGGSPYFTLEGRRRPL